MGMWRPGDMWVWDGDLVVLVMKRVEAGDYRWVANVEGRLVQGVDIRIVKWGVSTLH